MRYRIEHESAHRIRLRLYTGPLTDSQAQVLTYALSSIEEVTSVSVYQATGGIAVCYSHDRDLILGKLDSFQFENVTMLAEEMDKHPHIDEDEMRERKLSPQLKRKLRTRIVVEAAADMILPMPVQLAWHVYQFISLKDV